MNRASAKHRIGEIRHLPVPRTLGQFLLSTLSHAPDDIDAVTPIIAATPAIAVELFRIGPPPRAVSCSIPQMVKTAGLPVLRKALVHILAEDTFNEDGQEPLLALWRHSLGTALIAERLASRAPRVREHEAYLAGLFHHLGELVMLALDRVRYESVNSLVVRESFPCLDAERSEFGLDHTEAGKWFAAQKGLPQRVVDAIWLHHHAPDALVPHCFPTDLIAITGLASDLARQFDASNPADWDDETRERGRRFELDDAGLLRVVEELAPVYAAKRAWLDEPSSREPEDKRLDVLCNVQTSILNDAEDPVVLRRRIQRLEALQRFHESIRPEDTLRDILTKCADVVRSGLNVAPGLCFTMDTAERILIGTSWRALNGPFSNLFVELPDTETDREGTAPIVRAVRELGMAKIEPGWNGESSPVARERDGLIVVPMASGGGSYGQIVVDAENSGFGAYDEDIADLLLIARACGIAIARRHESERAESRLEELAAVLRPPRTGVAGPGPSDAAREDEHTALSRFAGAVVKAVGGSLGLISSQAQHMLAITKDLESHRALDSIVTECRRLNRVMTDLHAVAPRSRPRLEPNLINFRVHQFVSTMQQRLQKKGIRVKEFFAEGLPRVLMDHARMEHVFMNFMNRAETAMGESGGILTIQTGAAPDRRSVLIQFSYREESPTPVRSSLAFKPLEDPYPGEEIGGMGLAACRTILEEHGGRITSEENDNGDRTFTILLPAIGHFEVEVSSGGHEAPHPTGDLMTVLVVDDDDAVLEILKQTLQMRGFHVETAADGVQAWEIIRRKKLDLILLDLLMPNRDGLAVLRDLHDSGEAPPVVFMTGNASPQVREEALAFGARSFLVKPFELSRLLTELDTILAPQS